MNNKTNIKTGLSDNEVIRSRKKYGSNEIKSKKKNSFIKLVIESLSDPIIKILLIALGIKIIFLFKDENIFEVLGIAISIFIASFISSISEYGSEKAFEKLESENSNIKVKVIRNSSKKIISMNDLVVGDIVILESGDKVPADVVIVSGELYISDSSLTGESDEKHKAIGDTVYMGSTICSKLAYSQVVNVGEKTYYGILASKIQEKSNPSPLKNKLNYLAKIISIFGYIGAVLVFISYMYNAVVVKYDFDFKTILDFKVLLPHIMYALTLSVAVVVMAVPEGLPMMITLVLSSNMKRLVNKNVLVRKLVGIETSGSINVLLTDKTGTLTEGKLRVEKIIDAKMKNLDIHNDIVIQSLIYNNDAFISNSSIEGGNTTDRAIIEYFNTDKKDKYKILDKIEFNSKLKYSSIVTNYNSKTYFYKGAYEVIINKCNKYLDGNSEHFINNKNEILNRINEYAKEGSRILAFAISSSEYINNLTLVGFVILKDNIRDNSYEGINIIKNAGINVIMVTGDSSITANSIASKLGILGNDDISLNSDEFNKLNEEEVLKIIPKLKVISRSLPEDKYKLVSILESNGYICGMTGDGVNDAPALKKADVGFSMGSGTEIAKESSDIVILDNNIMSITTAILYGRTIYKSIRKFIVFQLSVNVCTVLLSIIGPFIGVLSPITVIQVLWVNMVMDTFSGLAFSFEPALLKYMSESPKNNKDKIINRYMINQILFDGLYSMILCIWFLKSDFINSIYRYDITNKYLMTAFFGLFIFIDIFNAFNARSQDINTFKGINNNKMFLFIFIMISVVQVILIYYGGYIFRTTGLTIYEFEIMIISAFSVIPADIIRKIIWKKKGLDFDI